MHKSQIFNSSTNDHIRNRLTHTMEVYQIARGISKALSLNDCLVESIALGHDLGHTPFGHVGERTLHNILMGHTSRELVDCCIHEGFKHNYQGLELIDIIDNGKLNYVGLNLSLAVRDGILKHTGNFIRLKDNSREKVIYSSLNLSDIDINKPAITTEGQVVAIADEIAQCTHDLEDGLRQEIIRKEDLLSLGIVKKVLDNHPEISPTKWRSTNDIRMSLLYCMIGLFISDVCKTTLMRLDSQSPSPQYLDMHTCMQDQVVAFSSEISKWKDELDSEKTRLILNSQKISISDSKAEYIIEQIFKAYYNHPLQLPDYILERYCRRRGLAYNRSKIDEGELKADHQFIRQVSDHIACMTDQYAEREYQKLYMPCFY